MASLKWDPKSKMQRNAPGFERASIMSCPHGATPATCVVCVRRLERLGLAVVQGHADEISCAQFLSRLTEGSSIPLSIDVDGDALLAGHAARCSSCAADLDAARGALTVLSGEQAPRPPSIPDFDLSFLRSPSAVPTHPGGMRAAAWLGLVALALLLSWWGWVRPAGPPAGNGRPSAAVPMRESGPSTAPSSTAPPTMASTPMTAAQEGPAGGWSSATAAVGLRGAPQAIARDIAAPTTVAIGVGSTATVAPSPSAARLPEATPLPPPETEEPDATEPLPSPTGAPLQPGLVSCALHAFGPRAGLFRTGCGPFRSATAFDLYQVTVNEPGLWSFDTCEGSGGLDTLLVLYPAGGFDSTTPCQRILAANDDGCGGLSRLTVDLGVGRYLLLVSEQSGDLSDHYRLGVEAPMGNDACPRISPRPTPLVPTSTPSALPSETAIAGPLPPPLSTPGASPEPLPIEPAPADPTGTPPTLP